MPSYLEITLDVATALSIMGAAATFFFQLRRHRRAELENEKWNFLKELASEIRGYKADIVKVIMDKHSDITKSEDVVFKEETYKETAWNDVVFLLNFVARKMTDAYYYTEYDLRKKAEVIANHYEDPRMDITEQVESFRADIEKLSDRLSDSLLAAVALEIPLMHYYTAHFLREVGVRTLGVDVRDFLPYSKPDEFLELILSVTPPLCSTRVLRGERFAPHDIRRAGCLCRFDSRRDQEIVHSAG